MTARAASGRLLIGLGMAICFTLLLAAVNAPPVVAQSSTLTANNIVLTSVSSRTSVIVQAPDIVQAFGTSTAGPLAASTLSFGPGTVGGVPVASAADAGLNYIAGTGLDGRVEFHAVTPAFAGLGPGMSTTVIIPFTIMSAGQQQSAHLQLEVVDDAMGLDEVLIDFQGTTTLGTDIVANRTVGPGSGAVTLTATSASGLAPVIGNFDFATGAFGSSGALTNPTIAVALAVDDSSATATASAVSTASAIAESGSTANASAGSGSNASAAAHVGSTASAMAVDASEARATAENQSSASVTAESGSAARAQAENASAATAAADDQSDATTIANGESTANSVATNGSTAVADADQRSITNAVAQTASESTADAFACSTSNAAASDSSLAFASSSQTSIATVFAEVTSISSGLAEISSDATSSSESGSLANAVALDNSVTAASAFDSSGASALAIDASTAAANAMSTATASAEATDAAESDADASNQSTAVSVSSANGQAVADADNMSVALADALPGLTATATAIANSAIADPPVVDIVTQANTRALQLEINAENASPPADAQIQPCVVEAPEPEPAAPPRAEYPGPFTQAPDQAAGPFGFGTTDPRLPNSVELPIAVAAQQPTPAPATSEPTSELAHSGATSDLLSLAALASLSLGFYTLGAARHLRRRPGGHPPSLI